MKHWKAGWLRGLCVVLCLSCGSLAQAGLTEAEVAKVQAAIARVWPNAGQVWPGADFSKLVLLLTDGSTLFELDASRSSKRTWSEVANQVPLRGDGFAFLEWQGRPAVAIWVGNSDAVDLRVAGQAVPYLFAFATHEAFHKYVQRGWVGPSTATGARATPYPVSVEPRLKRRMLFRSLVQAFNNQPEALGQAAYWYSSWRRDHAAEAQSIAWTDRSEGTATYFDVVATARAAVGFDSSPDQYRAALLDLIRLYDSSEWFVSVDGEGYGLGVVAGLVADQVRSGWKEAAREGKTILQTLLADVPPVPSPVAAADRESLERVVATRNGSAGKYLDPFLERWQAKDSVLLSLPFELVGSFTLSGFFTSDVAPGYTLYAGVTATLRLSGGELRLQDVTVASGVGTPCGQYRVVIPLRPNEVRVEGTRASVNIPGLNASFEVRPVSEAGRTLLCGS